ncbi:MAG: type I 3-dehydroquinate dehydratase [Caldimicrobium sp.]
MFCVVLAHPTWEGIYSQFEKSKPHTDLFELRLDSLQEISLEHLKSFLHLPYRFICTYRAYEEGGWKQVDPLERWKILEICCNEGAYLVDFEWKIFFKIQSILERSPYFPQKILFSYHHFQTTPSLKVLKGYLKKASNLGIKWFKITTFTERIENSLEFLTLIRYGKNLGLEIVAFNMGEKVKLSRVLSLFLGAPFTYVFPPSEKPLAPGQMDLLEAKRLWEILKNV